MEEILVEARIKYNRAEETGYKDEEYDAILENYKRNGGTFNVEGIRGDPGDIKLEYHMPSLNKIKGENSKSELADFLSKNAGPYSISDKIDGTSIQLIYKNGHLQIVSDGDDMKGSDVSFLKDFIKFPDLTYDCVIRGEFCITNENFNIAAPMLRERGLKGTNSRNMVNGVIIRKHTLRREEISLCSFVAFNVLSEEDWDIETKFNFLESNGFTLPSPQTYDTISTENLESILLQRREQSNYRIDGIVVVSVPMSTEKITMENPKCAIAFKVDTCAVTKVIGIEWTINSRYGKITPKAIIEPVDIMGTTLSKATCHNAKLLIDNGIGVGAKIIIQYAGDVIPKINSSIEKVTPVAPHDKNGVPYSYFWDENNTDVYLTNPENYIEVSVARLRYFVETMGIKHCGPSTLESFIQCGLCDISGFLRMRKDQLMSVDRIAEKSADRILEEIQISLRDIKYNKLMASTCFFGHLCGPGVMSKFIEAFPAWEIQNITEEQILSKHGFGPKRAYLICRGLPIFKNWLHVHPECLEKKVKMNDHQDLRGEIVVITGSRDKNMIRELEMRGATVKEHFVNGCTILLTDTLSSSSAKMTKAREKQMRTNGQGIRISLIHDLPNIVPR